MVVDDACAALSLVRFAFPGSGAGVGPEGLFECSGPRHLIDGFHMKWMVLLQGWLPGGLQEDQQALQRDIVATKLHRLLKISGVAQLLPVGIWS